MNAQKGSARAFARTVRNVVDWRGQKRTLFQCADELTSLPPIAVFWGDRDTVIPFSHAEALANAVDGVGITRFEGCGHYPHRENPDLFVRALRDFLDAPVAATTAWAAAGGVLTVAEIRRNRSIEVPAEKWPWLGAWRRRSCRPRKDEGPGVEPWAFVSRAGADWAKVPQGARAGKFMGASVTAGAWTKAVSLRRFVARGARRSSISARATTMGRSTARDAGEGATGCRAGLPMHVIRPARRGGLITVMRCGGIVVVGLARHVR
jgi:hypothetical protein